MKVLLYLLFSRIFIGKEMILLDNPFVKFFDNKDIHFYEMKE